MTNVFIAGSIYSTPRKLAAGHAADSSPAIGHGSALLSIRADCHCGIF
jgi:hypothetical protein